MPFITILMTIIVAVTTVLSCVSDVRALRIPNWHSLLIIGCFIPAWFCMQGAFDTIGSHLGSMAIIFVFTASMFFLGIIGGGDSKLGTALGLWIGMKGLVVFMLAMTIMGGLIGVATIIMRKKKPFKNPHVGGWVAAAQKGENAMPYGLAIVFGAWMAMLASGFVHNILNELNTIIH